MKKYSIPALGLALTLLLAACGGPAAETTPTPEPTPTPELFRFTRENFPKLDGSTATVPLGQAVA
ncbi:MAG: hypothetical protein J6J87_07105, partial [Oscillospiraceae bacterium]|nr:hypothetical protein [Oscillospiraceae bacterium]